MPSGSTRRFDQRYCVEHGTRSRKLPMMCPGCKGAIHFHEYQLPEARRGNPCYQKCHKCRATCALQPVAGRKGINVVLMDHGAPVYQLALKG